MKTINGSRKASTYAFYEFNLRLHLSPTLGSRPIASLTRADCRTLLTALRTKGLKVASLKGVNRTLSAVLSQAVEDDLLQTNPAFRMGRYLRAGDEPPAEIQPFTRAEAHAFLATVEADWPAYHAFFLVALRAGLRLGELLALKWEDVHLKARSLDVRRNRTRGKLTSTKNRQRRSVDLSLQTVAALRKLIVQKKTDSLKAGRPLPEWVFTTTDGEPLDGDNLRRRVFAKALTKAKLRSVRLHDLRHSYATHLIQQGESLAYVSRQLGHSSIKITVDTYAHWLPNADRSAVDKLDAVPVDATTCNPGATEDVLAKASADAK